MKRVKEEKRKNISLRKMKYKFVKNIGGSSRGTVLKVENDGKFYVIKDIRKRDHDEEDMDGIIKGSELQKLNHPNIVKIVATLEDEESYVIIMEFCDSDLGGYRAESEAEIASIIKKLVNVILFLKENGIIHNDIKLPNILMCGNEIKLTDFDLAEEIGPDGVSDMQPMGYAFYMAPEMGKGGHNHQINSWQIGMVLYSLLTGDMAPAFACDGMGYDSDYKFSLPDRVTEKYPEGVDLLHQLLKVDPKERITPEDILKHPFITKQE